MLTRPLLVAALLSVLPPLPAAMAGMARAEVPSAPSVADLAGTLQLDELIGVLRDEGLAYADTLDEDLFPGQGGSDWSAKAAVVYDADAMRARFMAAFSAALQDDAAAVGAAQVFFSSETGQRILALELEARRALMDTTVEDAARARVEEMRAADDPRIAALARFVEANDLVEANVQGALNANLAFYRGMVEVGGFGEAVDEGQMLADVWGQEDEVRAETEIWLYAYLAMAYDPLSDTDLAAYTDFSVTPAGQRLNAALFAAFDAVFVTVSRDLGRAAALQMQGQDI